MRFYVRSLAWSGRDPAPLQEGGRAAARRGLPRLRGAVRHRRHRRRHRLPRLLHRHQVGLQGYSSLEPARHRRLHRLRLGLPQHPRDRPARRRAGARRHGRLRLHRPARRDADLRGGRRPRGDGHPVAAVPRDDPHDRRASSRSSRSTSWACSRSYGATRFIVTEYFGQSKGTYDHYFHLFLPPVDVLLLVRQGHGLRGRDHPDPLLLRLHRLGRPGRGGRGRRQGGAHLDRGHQHRRLLLLAGDLGRHDHA